MKKEQLLRLARLGAIARIDAMNAELAILRKQFPELFQDTKPIKVGRRRLSMAERKAISRRMKAMWAAKRKGGR